MQQQGMLCCGAPHLNVECYVYKPNSGNDNIDLSTKNFFSKQDGELVEWSLPHLTLDVAGTPLL